MQWNVLYNKDIVELSLKEFGKHSKMLYLIELRKIFTPLIILIVIILIVCWVGYKVFYTLISKVYTTIYIHIVVLQLDVLYMEWEDMYILSASQL